MTIKEDREKRIKALEDLVHRMSEAGKADEDTIDDLRSQVVKLQEENLRLQETESALRENIDTLLDDVNILTHINTELRACLDDGVLIAKETIEVLDSKRPLLLALYRAKLDGTIQQCIDDVDFLNALVPGGGAAVERLVWAVLA